MTAVQRLTMDVGRAIVEDPSLDDTLPATIGETAPTPRADGTERAARAERREAMRASDEDRLASLMSLLSDPESLLTIAQSMVRDSQADGRQHDTETRQQVARLQESLRSDEVTRALTDARQAKESNDIADVLKVIGAALSVVVGVVGALFTGGASVVAAVGLVVALVGPMVCDALADAKVVPADVALGVGLGLAVVGSAMSFGAGAASGGVQVGCQAAKLAIQVTDTALRAAQATLSTFELGFRSLGAVEIADSSHHHAESLGAEDRRQAANESADVSAESVALLLQMFSRLGERLRDIRESRAEAMSMVTGALGRA